MASTVLHAGLPARNGTKVGLNIGRNSKRLDVEAMNEIESLYHEALGQSSRVLANAMGRPPWLRMLTLFIWRVGMRSVERST